MTTPSDTPPGADDETFVERPDTVEERVVTNDPRVVDEGVVERPTP